MKDHLKEYEVRGWRKDDGLEPDFIQFFEAENEKEAENKMDDYWWRKGVWLELIKASEFNDS